MRFSVSAVVAALPALAAAQENPLAQYQAQFQNFLSNMGSYIPNPGRHDPVAALEAKTGAMKMHTLTLDNWKDTLYEPVAKDTTEPVEWWVLTTGRNKTCFGMCMLSYSKPLCQLPGTTGSKSQALFSVLAPIY
jgi:hypothetical protein